MSSLKDAKTILQSLIDAGYDAYIVGGYVRDRLLHIENSDIDIATNARPEEVKKLFDKTILTGEKHGTITVRYHKASYEVTTFRKEENYINNRRPEKVHFVSELEEDLKRRDFTINALALTIDDKIIDLVKGKKDIAEKMIRTVGNPFERFEEDALRMLRAHRFVSTLGFRLEMKTKDAIKEKAHLIENISKERILSEFQKMMIGKSFLKSIDYLIETNLHTHLLELKKGIETIKSTGFQPSNLLEFLTLCSVSGHINKVFQLPISNHLKSTIHLIYEMYQVGLTEFSKPILFRNGLESCLITNKLNRYLRNKPDKKTEIIDCYHKLPIYKRCDLVFKGDDIIELYNKKPGGWIGDLLDEICLKVLLGELENDYQKIRQYLLSKE